MYAPRRLAVNIAELPEPAGRESRGTGIAASVFVLRGARPDRALRATCAWLQGSSSMTPNGPREPVIERRHEPGRAETNDRALSQRIRQQEILAELGVTALKGASFNDLLEEAVRLSA